MWQAVLIVHSGYHTLRTYHNGLNIQELLVLYASQMVVKCFHD